MNNIPETTDRSKKPGETTEREREELAANTPKRAPLTSVVQPRPGSRLAVREDGALLVSLEDAGDRDTTGREVIAFMVLTTEEAARARSSVQEACSSAAANTIGRLPKKPA